MNAIDPRPSLGNCNAAAGLARAASNWQRAPRPPVRMGATAPRLSDWGTDAVTRAPLAPVAPLAAPRAMPAVPQTAAVDGARSEAAPALRVCLRGPGPQNGAQSSPTPRPLPSSAAPGFWPVSAVTSPAAQPARPAEPAPARSRHGGHGTREAVFEFTGSGALSVQSSITGRCYRFEQPGARLVVDARDVTQLSRVTLLRCLPAAS